VQEVTRIWKKQKIRKREERKIKIIDEEE